MALERAWQTVEGWFVPPALRKDWRAGFIVRAWLSGGGILLLFTVSAAQQGLWVLMAAQAATLVAGVLILLVLRYQSQPTVAMRLSMLVVLASFSSLGLLQTPPNPITPMFNLLVPLLASFFLTWRETQWWLLAAIVSGGSAEYLVAAGLHLETPPREHADAVAALNYVGVLLVVTLFARWFYVTREEMVGHLEHALKARTRFLANVSHEIRTPMNAVLGLTELLMTTPLEDAQRRQLELVRESGDSLVALIDDLLDLTRLDSGRLVLTPVATDVRGLVESVGLLFLPRAKEKGLRLDVRVEPLPPRALLDPLRFRQVLSNLLSNAVKFTASGTVTVRCGTKDERLEVEVRDTGPGIPPEGLARLFQAFEQGDASTTRRFGGSGLGLALSRDLVRLMGGELGVDSALGRGSRFHFWLPLEPDDATPSPEAAVPLRAPTLSRPVLVVDDNPVNLLVARGIVERLGYAVDTATNGLEAAEATERRDYALVLMDCHMPEMDGFEATRRIRARSGGDALPIVALTASGLPEEVAACRAAGMNECLVKPLRVERLVEVLRRVVPAEAGASG